MARRTAAKEAGHDCGPIVERICQSRPGPAGLAVVAVVPEADREGMCLSYSGGAVETVYTGIGVADWAGVLPDTEASGAVIVGIGAGATCASWSGCMESCVHSAADRVARGPKYSCRLYAV